MGGLYTSLQPRQHCHIPFHRSPLTLLCCIVPINGPQLSSSLKRRRSDKVTRDECAILAHACPARKRDGATDPPRGSTTPPPAPFEPKCPCCHCRCCGGWTAAQELEELNRSTAAASQTAAAASKPETVCSRFENKSSLC